jgi:hypothetical protein
MKEEIIDIALAIQVALLKFVLGVVTVFAALLII